MEGAIFDIKHFAVHDGPGIRQTVFFKGCPLNCWWCHNPESQNIQPEKFVKVNKLDGKEYRKEESIGYKISVDELFKIIQGDQIFFEESNGGVTFSGGEPLMQADFLTEIIKKCKSENIHTCVDTTAFSTQHIIEKVAKLTDTFLYDIKIIDENLHKKFTGVSAKQVLSNLLWLDQSAKDVVLRFPVIPGITDTQKNLSKVISFVKSLKNINKIDLLPYHNISNGKYTRFGKENKMKDANPITDNEMLELKMEFETIGFEVGIGG